MTGYEYINKYSVVTHLYDYCPLHHMNGCVDNLIANIKTLIEGDT